MDDWEDSIRGPCGIRYGVWIPRDPNYVKKKDEQKAPEPPKAPANDSTKIKVDNQTGAVVPKVALELKTPDGSTEPHETRTAGIIESIGLQSGNCEISGDLNELELRHTLLLAGVGDSPIGQQCSEEKICEPVPGKRYRIASVEKHKVKKNETLASIARTAGMTWQALAKFNWGTDDPDKVNQLLHCCVGCKNKTDDVKNYIFDDADDLGIICIPKKCSQGDLATNNQHTIRVKPFVEKHDVLYWYERDLILTGYSSGPAAHYAERIFQLPDLDFRIPIAEGFSPADWVGYHTGKHGLYDRFTNFKNESVNMGELFFNEKYRWVRPEFKDADGNLSKFTEAEFNSLLDKAYKNAPGQSENLSWLFDSDKFTKDVENIFDKYRSDPKATIWQGRYYYSKTGDLGDLQTNVDFLAKGNKFRIAIDAKSGKILNFFLIDEKFKPMEFYEIIGKWKGEITNIERHQSPNSTIIYESSSTWKGLIIQGIKGGAISGGLISAFFGAMSGFRNEGIPGALKGMSMGLVIGGVTGAGIGGVIAVASRLSPALGKILTFASMAGTFLLMILDPSEIALDPQEWAESKKDNDGNLWKFRNIEKKGTFFPDYNPRGIRVECTDKTIIEMGEERPYEASYQATPITVFARNVERVKWFSIVTPEGSRMWWWQDLKSQEEHIVTFRDENSENNALNKFQKEESYRY